MTKALIASKIIVLLIAFGVLFFVINTVFMPFGGEHVLEYNFENDADYISHLYPWQRLSPVTQDDSGYYQNIQDEIVYFDVELKQFFKNVEVELVVYVDNLEKISLGPKFGEEEYKLVNRDVEVNKLQTLKFNFDIQGSSLFNNKLTWQLAAQDLLENQTELKIYNIKMKFTNPTINTASIKKIFE